jgi:hypothetical protein
MARRRARLALNPDPTRCSIPECRNLRDVLGGNICRPCLDKKKVYKDKYRARPKPPDTCTASDCMNSTEGTEFQMCRRCRDRRMVAQRAKPHYNRDHRAMQRRARAEVVKHYGPACKCCGEDRDPFLVIDHIEGDGYKQVDKAGRRIRGHQLYGWLRSNDFPDGYRVLCVNCNHSLAHQGYCPHGDLTQNSKRGRPALKPVDPIKRAKRRAYWIAYKTEVLSHYGDGSCACCGIRGHEFLTIDHLNQTGAAHRKEINGNAQDGRNFMTWLRQNGYPPGYQVLCMACNFATRMGQTCPHQL